MKAVLFAIVSFCLVSLNLACTKKCDLNDKETWHLCKTTHGQGRGDAKPDDHDHGSGGDGHFKISDPNQPIYQIHPGEARFVFKQGFSFEEIKTHDTYSLPRNREGFARLQTHRIVLAHGEVISENMSFEEHTRDGYCVFLSTVEQLRSFGFENEVDFFWFPEGAYEFHSDGVHFEQTLNLELSVLKFLVDIKPGDRNQELEFYCARPGTNLMNMSTMKFLMDVFGSKIQVESHF